MGLQGLLSTFVALIVIVGMDTRETTEYCLRQQQMQQQVLSAQVVSTCTSPTLTGMGGMGTTLASMMTQTARWSKLSL